MDTQTRKDLANVQEILDQRIFEIATFTPSLLKKKNLAILYMVLMAVVLAKKLT